MHIVCPHCTTSYAIDPATLGADGRTVRCSRCKEVWLARPEDAIAPEPAMSSYSAAGAGESDAAAEWDTMAHEEAGEDGLEDTPEVDSPSIAGDFPADSGFSSHIDDGDWQTMARQDGHDEADDEAILRKKPWFHRLLLQFAGPKSAGGMAGSTVTCAAMGALVIALLIWRADVVRLMPQTAAFYRMVGLDVNLREVQFKDIKVTTETVDGKPVLVIQGMIVGQNRKPVDLPRLRFAVRDAQGAEIYAWNTVLDQSVLQPGDHAAFKARLASPPAEGKSIDIRFFNKRDIAGGSV
jgi:predicted Zn finger-like uncharacterized protein